MQIKFDVAPEDFARARFYQASAPRNSVGMRSMHQLVLTSVDFWAIIAIGAGLAALVIAVENRQVTIGVISFAAAMIGLAGLLRFARRLRFFLQFPDLGDALGAHEVEISDEFMMSKTPSRRTLLRWYGLARLEYSDGDIFYAGYNQPFEIIPSHAFGSKDEAASFFASMMKLWQAAAQRAPATEQSFGRPHTEAAPPVAASGPTVTQLPQLGPTLNAERLVDIRYTLTADDTFEIIRERIYRSAAIYGGCLAALYLFVWWKIPTRSSLSCAAGLCAGYAATFCITVGKATLSSMRRNNSNILGEMRSDVRLLTDFRYMRVEMPGSINYFAVTNILKASRFRRHIELRLSPVSTVLIPTSAFDTAADKAAFERRLREAVRTKG